MHIYIQKNSFSELLEDEGGTYDMALVVPPAFALSAVCKESACNAGDLGSIPGLGKSPGEGNGNPLQYPCLEKSHGQRSLGGYSPQGRKSQTRLSD